MSLKFQKTLVAGIMGTALMTVFMMLAPLLGMPKMSTAEMLSQLLEMPLVIGWIIHFAIGIGFALFYTYICLIKHKIKNEWIKGVVFGIVVFIVAQLLMALISKFAMMPSSEGSMTGIIIESLLAHIIYGICVVKMVGDYYKT